MRRPNLDDLLFTYDKRYKEILGFQRLVLLGLPHALQQAWDDAQEFGDYAYDADYGDVDSVMWDRIPTTDDEVKQHLGIMLVVRAVALAEYTLAHIAATFFTDPGQVVFEKNKAWRWWQAKRFYETGLKTPFALDEFGFETISDLRNYYAHSYGVFQNEADSLALQAKIMQLVGAPQATAEERNLRYTDNVAVLGSSGGWDQFAPVVRLGDLATLRLLEITKKTVHGAFRAADDGLLPAEQFWRSKYGRTWLKDHKLQLEEDEQTAV